MLGFCLLILYTHIDTYIHIYIYDIYIYMYIYFMIYIYIPQRIQVCPKERITPIESYSEDGIGTPQSCSIGMGLDI